MQPASDHLPETPIKTVFQGGRSRPRVAHAVVPLATHFARVAHRLQQAPRRLGRGLPGPLRRMTGAVVSLACGRAQQRGEARGVRAALALQRLLGIAKDARRRVRGLRWTRNML